MIFLDVKQPRYLNQTRLLNNAQIPQKILQPAGVSMPQLRFQAPVRAQAPRSTITAVRAARPRAGTIRQTTRQSIVRPVTTTQNVVTNFVTSPGNFFSKTFFQA